MVCHTVHPCMVRQGGRGWLYTTRTTMTETDPSRTLALLPFFHFSLSLSASLSSLTLSLSDSLPHTHTFSLSVHLQSTGRVIRHMPQEGKNISLVLCGKYTSHCARPRSLIPLHPLRRSSLPLPTEAQIHFQLTHLPFRHGRQCLFPQRFQHHHCLVFLRLAPPFGGFQHQIPQPSAPLPAGGSSLPREIPRS